ncbi:MAG: hypothetical protein K2O03_00290, partial [Lachnospiraceae bacterium]|nr:hypothetical protein [Lachnospiraceae bacterium]
MSYDILNMNLGQTKEALSLAFPEKKGERKTMEMKKCKGKCFGNGNEKSRYRKREKYSRMTAFLLLAALLFLECPSVRTLSADANAMQMQDMG